MHAIGTMTSLPLLLPATALPLLPVRLMGAGGEFR